MHLNNDILVVCSEKFTICRLSLEASINSVPKLSEIICKRRVKRKWWRDFPLEPLNCLNNYSNCTSTHKSDCWVAVKNRVGKNWSREQIFPLLKNFMMENFYGPTLVFFNVFHVMHFRCVGSARTWARVRSDVTWKWRLNSPSSAVSMSTNKNQSN